MFTTYSASAGSGKTTQLVADYLTLCFRSGAKQLLTSDTSKLLEHISYQKILAITFTNNASAEMKDRILRCLNVFAFQPDCSSFSGSDKAIYDKIITQLFPNSSLKPKTVENFVQKESLELLRHIVYDYARFTLTTIDSFFQRVIRSSALMLHLNLNYAVQITAEEYYLEVTNQILNELPHNAELANKISYLLEHKMEEKGKLNIDKEFSNVLEMAYDEKSFFPSFYLDKNHLADSIKKWSRRLTELKNLPSAPTKEQTKEANVCKALLEYSDLLYVMSDLKNKMDELLARDNIFLLRKSNQLIYNTLYGNNSSMAIFERINFSHFFIDEFQDTSRMQWDDLVPLLKNDALDVSGNVTLFGDLKQAIYRFRNGDAEIFYNLIDWSRFNKLTDFKNVTKANYRTILLDTNYRSSQSVIEFNNMFFPYLLSESHSAKSSQTPEPVSKAESYYKDVAQKVPASNSKKGLVKLIVSLPNDIKEFTISQDNVVDKETYYVLQAVEDALNRGYQLKDIAILVSSNANCVKFSDALLKKGHSVISDAFLSLDTSQAVNVIICTLKLLYSPNDKLAQATILHYLSENKHDFKGKMPTISEFYNIQNINFFNIINNCCGKTFDRINWLSKPLLLLVKDIIALFKLQYSEENNQSRSDPYIADFLNVVLQYSESRKGDPYKFLEWWQQCLELSTVPCLSFPKGVNAITVSTVHKSKGLEYPVVIYYYTLPKPGLDPIWLTCHENELFPSSSDETVANYIKPRSDMLTNNKWADVFTNAYQQEKALDDLDNLNKHYVSHTRAKDVLYVISKAKLKGRGRSMYGDSILAFVDKKNGEGTNLFTQKSNDESHAEYDYGDSDWKNPNGDLLTLDTDTLQISISDFGINFSRVNGRNTVSKSDNQRLSGIFIHDFLAKLSAFPQEDDQIEKVLADVPEEKKSTLREILKRLITDPELQPYFAPDVEVLNEISILDTDGELHRPDRIVFMKDKVMILDYKTGVPNSQYEQQINQYCQLMKAMGYEKVESRLIYL